MVRLISPSRLALAFALAALAAPVPALEWERTIINPASNFEAAGVADINKDGALDIVCGDAWYSAPDWKINPICKIEEMGGYRLDFANTPMDVNGDGWVDIVSCNWHDTSVKWRQNPGAEGGEWKEFLVDRPGNMETAIAVDVDGDGALDFLPDVGQKTVWYRLEGGVLVPRVVHPQIGGHGIGFGDVNGDSRGDIVKSGGWFEAPADRLAAGDWLWHPEAWGIGAAGISIIVHDFTGDGMADIFWGMGHDYGTHWLEQTRDPDPAKRWIARPVDKDWSQPHALVLADLNGDGREDVVTGKRKYAHTTDPGAEDPMVIFVYFFDPGSKAFTRETIHQGEGDGLGLAPVVIDIDGDGDLDIVAPGKSGLYLHKQKTGSGPTEPKKASSAIKVPEGFELTLFASEPEIRKPIAMAFDERGRMIVAEASEYPLGPRPGEAPKDAVKILEDTDGDGAADVVKVFADGLNIPDGVAAGHGGIYIAEAPNLWHMRDTNGDDRADERKAILTNFGTQDSHHLVHGLVWSPEGKLMMSQGCSTISDIVADGRDWHLGEGNFFSCWPDGTGFSIPFKSFTNSWGYDWDDYGNWIANDNEGPHLLHLVEGGDYGLALTRRRAGQPGILPGVDRTYGNSRGYLVQAGLTIYSGDAFPGEFQGCVIQGAPAKHRVIRDSLEPAGATFLASLEDDLMATEDPWHRPIAMSVGPDGAVYVIDWYNEILAHVEHPLDSPRRDKSRGRIYRVAWKEAGKRAVPDLRGATAADLAANLRLENKWLRRTSQRLLAAKGEEAFAAVQPLLAAKESPRTRLHALWTIEETRLAERPDRREAVEAVVLALLSDPDPRVRAGALRTGRHLKLDSSEFARGALALALEGDDFGRFEAAMAIAALPKPLPLSEVSELLARAQWEDPFLGYAFERAFEPYKDELIVYAMQTGARGLAGEDRRYLPALLRLRDPRAEPLLLALLRLPDLDSAVIEETIAGLYGFKSPEVFRALVAFLESRPELPPNLVRPILEEIRRRPPENLGAEGDAIGRVLARLAERGDPSLLADVFRTAGYAGRRELAPHILAALASRDAAAAEAAILAAGELQIAEAEAPLAARLASADARGRWAILKALSAIARNPALAPEFMAALGSPDSSADAALGLARLSLAHGGEAPPDVALLEEALARGAAGNVVMTGRTARALDAWIAALPDEAAKSRARQKLAAGEGILRDWLIAGPFPNPETKGHTTPYPPEQNLDASAQFEAFGKKFGWTPGRADDPNGVYSFAGIEPNLHVVAYAWTKFQAAHAGPATLFAGSDDSIKVWLNGAVVHDHLIDRGLQIDQDQAPVTLREGENEMLVKVGQNGGGWNFHARLATVPAAVAADPANLAVRALHLRGDAGRGEAVFFGSVGCARCHAVGDRGGRVGPDLTRVARYQPKSYLARSILEPSAEIAAGFGGVSVATSDGASLEGYIHRETPAEIVLVTAEGKAVTIPKAKIAERREHASSGMPEDLEQTIAPQEFVDLVAFLEERR